MDEFKIRKILNNNVVIAEKNFLKLVLAGKGLGFDSSKGTKIDPSRIESIFVEKSSDLNKNFVELLKNVNMEGKVWKNYLPFYKKLVSL